MRGGPESATHVLADDLHALIALRLTVRRVTAGMIWRGDIDTCINAGNQHQATINPAAVRRPHLSFLGTRSCDHTHRQPLYVVRRVLGRRRARDGSMEVLIEWEDGEAPPPPSQWDEDEIEDAELGIRSRTGDTQTAGNERTGTESASPDHLAAGHGYGVVAARYRMGQAQREEVDFLVAGEPAGVGLGAGVATQWLQKAAAERLVGQEMLQEAVLAYHRKVSHIARLVASG